jgi:uncharacterized protein YxeA
MKKILLAVLLMITSIAAFSQQKPRQPQYNQFRDYVEFRKEYHRPNFRPHQFPMHPKPLSITVKGNKVIVVFKKEDFQRLRPMVINRNRRVFIAKQRSKMQQRFFNKFEN